MTEQNFGSKELYELVIKTNSPLKIANREFEKGETIMILDSVDVLGINEDVVLHAARGGKGNFPYIVWDDRGEAQLNFSRGVISPLSYSMLLASNTLLKTSEDPIYMHKLEGPYELNNSNQFTIEESPLISNDRKMFCYEYDLDCVQAKVNFSCRDKTVTVTNGDQNKFYIVDYYYVYNNEATIYRFDTNRITTTFSMEGKYYYQDENDGVTRTALINIPKARIIGNINLHYGDNISPNAESFNVIALPVLKENKQTIMEIIHLNDEIETLS